MPVVKEKPDWFKLDPSKFLSDVLVDSMNAAEFGATVRLIMRQWLDGWIPDDLMMLSRLCRMTLSEMESAWPMVSRFFPEIEPGKRANRFMWCERAVVMAEFERKRDAGKEAANRQWDAKKAATRSKKEALPQESDSSPVDGRRVTQGSPKGHPMQDIDIDIDIDIDKDKEQKPSRAKAARATKSAATDERHAVFKAAVKTYWDAKNPGVEMPWGPIEGKQLGMWLREAPHITLDQFTGFLRARFKSDVNHSERPSQWIRWVTRYASGPIDRFGKPLTSGENGNGTNKPSVTGQRVANNRAALAKAAERFGWANPDGADSANGRSLPEPRPDGLAGGVLVGFPATGPEILPPESHSGPGGTQAQTGAELLSATR